MTGPIFDLTNQMQQVGSLFVSEMRLRMMRQIGVDGSHYYPLKPATIKQKMMISIATANLRMIRTKDFIIHAFKFQAYGDHVRVFISNEPHGRDLRAAKESIRTGSTKNPTKTHKTVKRLAAKAVNITDLATWQLETGASKFFPQNENEITGMESFSQGMRILEEEAYRQAKERMKFSLRTNINLG